jgi:hypothetical protein
MAEVSVPRAGQDSRGAVRGSRKAELGSQSAGVGFVFLKTETTDVRIKHDAIVLVTYMRMMG